MVEKKIDNKDKDSINKACNHGKIFFIILTFMRFSGPRGSEYLEAI